MQRTRRLRRPGIGSEVADAVASQRLAGWRGAGRMRGLRSPPRASPPHGANLSRALHARALRSLRQRDADRPRPLATAGKPFRERLQVVVIERRTPQTARKPSYYEVASHEILSSVRRSVRCSPNPAAARRMRLGSHPTSQESGSRQAQSTLQEAGATARKLRTGQGASRSPLVRPAYASRLRTRCLTGEKEKHD